MPIEAQHLAHARELHDRALVFAIHTDICPDVGNRQRAGETRVFAERHSPGLKKGGITAICDHVAGDAPYLIDFPFRNMMAANRLKFALQGIEAMYIEEATSPNDIVIATSVQMIRDAKKEGRVAIVLCFEGASV